MTAVQVKRIESNKEGAKTESGSSENEHEETNCKFCTDLYSNSKTEDGWIRYQYVKLHQVQVEIEIFL